MRIDEKIRRKTLVMGGAVLVALPTLGPTIARAATSYYAVQGANGNWNDASNWVSGSNSSTTNGGTYPLLASSDVAFIEPTSVANNETINVIDAEGAATVEMEPAINTTGTINITGAGATLTINGGSPPLSNGGGSSYGASVVDITNGGELINSGTGSIELGASQNATSTSTMTVNIGGGSGTSTFVASQNTSASCLIGDYSTASVFDNTGGSMTAAATVYVGYGNYKSGQLTPLSAWLQVNGGSFATTGGTLGAGNGIGISICRDDNGGELGLLELTSGTFSTTGAINVGSAAGSSSTSAPTPNPTAIFQVDGSTMSAINVDTNGIATGGTATNGLDITPGTGSAATEKSELKVFLDGDGSTLINVTGNVVLTNATLDVDPTAGFTDAGDDPDHTPGLYLLASYTGTLTTTGLTATSDDTGFLYIEEAVNENGANYLAIQVVPEPVSLLGLTLVGGLALLGRPRSRVS